MRVCGVSAWGSSTSPIFSPGTKSPGAMARGTVERRKGLAELQAVTDLDQLATVHHAGNDALGVGAWRRVVAEWLYLLHVLHDLPNGTLWAPVELAPNGLPCRLWP